LLSPCCPLPVFPTDSCLFAKPDGPFLGQTRLHFHLSFPFLVLVMSEVPHDTISCPVFPLWLVSGLGWLAYFFGGDASFETSWTSPDYKPEECFQLWHGILSFPCESCSSERSVPSQQAYWANGLVQGTCWPMKRDCFCSDFGNSHQLQLFHNPSQTSKPSVAEFDSPYHCLGCWEITNKNSRAKPLTSGLLSTTLASEWFQRPQTLPSKSFQSSHHTRSRAPADSV
jgi:hypothetical protein